MRPILLLSALLFGVAADATTVSNDISLEERIQAMIINEKELMRQVLDKMNNVMHETDLMRQELNKMNNAMHETDLMRQELNKMNNAMHETTMELDQLRQENAVLHEMCKATTTHENELRVKRQHSQSVAFHAYQSGEKCILDMQTFVYEQVLLNDGNGYSPHDGIFDAPVSGVYVLTWSVANANNWFTAELIVDGVSRGVTSAENVPDHGLGTGTSVVVLFLRTGSHVFVRRLAGLECTVLNRDTVARNTFSGWLLYP